MMLARGFFVVSVLAVISSASASLLGSAPAGASGKQPPATERYYGPSEFA